MEEMRNDTVLKTQLNAIIKIMKNFNITVQEAMRILEIPESEHARYMAAL